MKYGCLIGLAIGARATGAAERLQAVLCSGGGARHIRVVDPRDLHVTLRFLGHVDEARLLSLGPRLAELAGRYPLGPVVVSTLGAAPTIDRPALVLASIPHPAPRLCRLHAALDGMCIESGFAPLPRPWRAHMSLARVEAAIPGGPISDFVRENHEAHLGEADISRLILYGRAENTPGGRLLPLAHWALTDV